LGAKLIGIFLFVVLALSTMAVVATEEARDSLVSTIGTDTINFAQSIALSVDASIYLKYHELWLLGSGAFAQTDLADSNAEFDALPDLEGYIDSIEEEWTDTPSSETTPLMDAILANNISECVTDMLVYHYKEEHGYAIYNSVVVANKYGVVIGMDSRTSGYRQDLSPWWSSLMEDGYYFGKVEYDPWRNTHLMVVAVKLSTMDGNYSGAVIGHLDIVSLVDQAVFLGKPYQTTEMLIIRNDGLLVYSSSVFSIFENVSDEQYFMDITGQSGYFLLGAGDNEKLYSYSRTSGYMIFSGNEWIILINYSASEALGAVDDLSSKVLTLALPLLAVSVAVSYLFALSVSKRIRTVADAAHEFSTGKLDRRVGFTGSDEIGQLGNSFDVMAKELSALYEDLEGKVAERSKEVEQANKKLRLLGSITRHDALNQISIITGWISLAEESTDDKELLTTLGKIKDAAVNLAANLEFTRVYEKVGVKKPEWTQMDRTLTQSLFGIGPHKLKLHNGLGGLQVYCDPMIQNVLRNLVDNSIRHGGDISKVSFTYSETPDGLLMVYEDDGKGIPYDRKNRLFEPGIQAGRKSYGLYLSREILSITGITIRECGVPGKGARFELLAPKGRYRVDYPERRLREEMAE
jgi:signal transduction histidine kinase